MSKHTPGPWHTGNGLTSKYTIYDRYSQRVANSFEGVMVIQRSDATCEANARLIAAAPELLEALDDAALELEGAGKREAAKVARAVIAKALGEKNE